MKFKDLQEGEKFISWPLPEDIEESWKPFYIFIKIAKGLSPAFPPGRMEFEYLDNMVNAVRLKDGNLSNMPDDMEVLKIE
jgi:hypothetical protein